MVKLAGKQVGTTGFGLMGFTWRATPVPEEQALDAMKAALENGANFWNGGEFYGPPEYNSLHLLRAYFTKYPEDADKVVLSIKGAFNTQEFAPDCSAAGVRRSMDNCLAVLAGTKKIDMFECARVDQTVPIEETIETLAEYVKAGTLGGICLSEAGVDTIRRAAAVHRIEGVELEMSMYSTDLLDARRDISEACAELGIAVIAYSPLGKGFLTGQLKTPADIPEGDVRRMIPRFQSPNFEKNLRLTEQVAGIAARKGATSGQVALAWLREQGRVEGLPTFLPIPGATTRARVLENSTEVQLTPAEVDELNRYVKESEPAGDRTVGILAQLNYGETPKRE